jgi:hypothetical protein
MAAESRIVTPDGTTVAHVLTCDFRFYLIDNESLRMIDEIEAYCWDCRQFVASERIRTPEDVANELDWLTTLSGEEREKAEFIYGTAEAIAEKFKNEQAFFRNRISTPRCLDCGSTNILQARPGFGTSPTRLYHPDYGPIGLTVETFAFASTASFYRLFDVEGEELKMPIEDLVDTVNRCEGKRVCCTRKDGKLFYGRTFEEA